MKKFIITDPCYICDNDEVWREYCRHLGNADRSALADEILSKYLGTKIETCSTGCGDWSNEILGDGVLQEYFCADAGLFCVVELTDRVREIFERKHHGSKIDDSALVAVFECNEIENIVWDRTCEDWTVVEIRTSEGIVSSDELHYDDEYDDDDYLYEYDEDVDDPYYEESEEDEEFEKE